MSDIEEKVAIAMQYLIDENIPPSISAVCKYAGVSRANLYATYPDLVNKIKSFKVKKDSAPSKNSRTTSLIDENKKLKKQLKTLGYICVELRHALDLEKDKSRHLMARLEKVRR